MDMQEFIARNASAISEQLIEQLPPDLADQVRAHLGDGGAR